MRRLVSSGFTLIEIMVALAIFGVLSALAYMTLGQTLDNSDMLTERMDRLQSVQRSMAYLSSDLLRPHHARSGQTLAASPRCVRVSALNLRWN